MKKKDLIQKIEKGIFGYECIYLDKGTSAFIFRTENGILRVSEDHDEIKVDKILSEFSDLPIPVKYDIFITNIDGRKYYCTEREYIHLIEDKELYDCMECFGNALENTNDYNKLKKMIIDNKYYFGKHNIYILDFFNFVQNVSSRNKEFICSLIDVLENFYIKTGYHVKDLSLNNIGYNDSGKIIIHDYYVMVKDKESGNSLSFTV